MPSFGKILFIDDDIITVTVCERMMKLLDFTGTFNSCEDGRKAKEYLSSKTHDLPDIIFVDLHMTVMSGWEFLAWFNEWAKQQDIKIPVYVLSSSLYKEDYERAETYKTDGFIVKPVTAAHLKAIASKFQA